MYVLISPRKKLLDCRSKSVHLANFTKQINWIKLRYYIKFIYRESYNSFYLPNKGKKAELWDAF